MKYAAVKCKTLVEFTKHPTHPGSPAFVREQPRGTYAAECEAEYDSLMFMLDGEMQIGKGRALPNKKDRISYPMGSLRAGEVCRISECRNNFLVFDNQTSGPVCYFQLIIQPSYDILAVTHQLVHIGQLEQKDQLRLIASANGRSGSLTVHNNVDVYLASLNNEDVLRRGSPSRKGTSIYVMKGCIEMHGQWLRPSTRMIIKEGHGELMLVSRSDDTHVLLIEAA